MTKKTLKICDNDKTNYGKLLEQVKRHEGAVKQNGRHFVYNCPTGRPTIGYGTNLEWEDIDRATKDDFYQHGITEEKAVELLEKDLRECEAQIQAAKRHKKAHYETLNPVRVCVLINMAFNMGWQNLQGFRNTWAALEVGDYEKAAAEMLDSKWARQVGARSEELADQMRTGKWKTKKETKK